MSRVLYFLASEEKFGDAPLSGLNVFLTDNITNMRALLRSSVRWPCERALRQPARADFSSRLRVMQTAVRSSDNEVPIRVSDNALRSALVTIHTFLDGHLEQLATLLGASS